MNDNKNYITKKLLAPVINLIQVKKYEEALHLLNNLFDQISDENIINKIKGLIYLKKRDWLKSLQYYEKISKKKMDYEIFNNIGVALYKIGKYSDASFKFKQAINNKNKYLPAYENFCVTNKLLGNFETSINFSIQALKLMPHNNKIKNNLIDILNYFEPKKIENNILEINNQIRELNFENNVSKFIEESKIYKILNSSEKILEKNNFTINYPHTQIFKKNSNNLNCERHLSLFEKHKIIPKFCFSCYKVQITLDDVLNLLKLYFYFNKLNLKKNNIRKCIVELRSKVIGNYKGYIFCSSVIEAKTIKRNLIDDLTNEKINVKNIEIKHGCSEYYEEFKQYKSINEDLTNKIYQTKWMDIEKKFDEKNFFNENTDERVFFKTINLFNLPDFLIMKNWFIYAKIIGDNSYKNVYKSHIKIDHLSQIEMQKIIMRKKIN